MRSNQRYTNEKKRASRNKGTLRQSKKSRRREYRAPVVVTSFRRATNLSSDAKRRKSKRTRARTSASNVRMSRARTRNRTYRSAASSSTPPATDLTNLSLDHSESKKSILEELIAKPEIMDIILLYVSKLPVECMAQLRSVNKACHHAITPQLPISIQHICQLYDIMSHKVCSEKDYEWGVLLMNSNCQRDLFKLLVDRNLKRMNHTWTLTYTNYDKLVHTFPRVQFGDENIAPSELGVHTKHRLLKTNALLQKEEYLLKIATFVAVIDAKHKTQIPLTLNYRFITARGIDMRDVYRDENNANENEDEDEDEDEAHVHNNADTNFQPRYQSIAKLMYDHVIKHYERVNIAFKVITGGIDDYTTYSYSAIQHTIITHLKSQKEIKFTILLTFVDFKDEPIYVAAQEAKEPLLDFRLTRNATFAGLTCLNYIFKDVDL